LKVGLAKIPVSDVKFCQPVKKVVFWSHFGSVTNEKSEDRFEIRAENQVNHPQGSFDFFVVIFL
jgi:hypothetical protein